MWLGLLTILSCHIVAPMGGKEFERFGFLTAIGTTYTLIYNNPAKNLYGVPEEETNLGNSTLMELCNLN